jgi:hypothetical protein
MERIYIAQGERGLFKVGKTANFDNRLILLRKQFRERGDSIARHHAFAEIDWAHPAESRLIRSVADLAQERRDGKEWFAGVEFEAALALGHKHTSDCDHFRKTTPEEAARHRERYLELRRQVEARNARRREQMAALEREMAYRRLLRAHGERSFSVLVEAITRPDASWSAARLQPTDPAPAAVGQGA